MRFLFEATGAGKTHTAITPVYRLLKFGGAKRVLFLGDTRNLGKQAHRAFMPYTPPDDLRRCLQKRRLKAVGRRVGVCSPV